MLRSTVHAWLASLELDRSLASRPDTTPAHACRNPSCARRAVECSTVHTTGYGPFVSPNRDHLVTERIVTTTSQRLSLPSQEEKETPHHNATVWCVLEPVVRGWSPWSRCHHRSESGRTRSQSLPLVQTLQSPNSKPNPPPSSPINGLIIKA